ncbi:flagellar hook assembly protein FlgD [Diaminobutyricibacter sp. McL0608]|uniref:flagellar hook assembly protein FlgD n=1 Tax=Leifsonia sp. McL0608 TaxID=3143537 RepID=UPI0031F3302E
MTAVDPISASSGGSSIYATDNTLGTPKQTMDADLFMKLLVTQLQNQDPSSPMDTNQMISQTTQLSMMQSLATLNSTNTESFALAMRTNAAALIGQQVSYLDKNGDTQTGKATSVSFSGSVPTVTVGGIDVSLDSISALTLAN